MKNLIKILILLAIFFGVYYYVTEAPSDSPDTGTLAEAPILRSLAPDVFTSSSLSPDWLMTKTEAGVEDGMKIKTSPTGRALISSGSDILTALDVNTEISFIHPEGSGSKFDMKSGKMWSRLNRALEQDEVYEVYTPTMVAAVRGTSFGTIVGEGEKILVTEGTVAASLKDPLTGLAVPGSEILVFAGNKVSVTNGKMTVSPIEESDRDSWFYTYNEKPVAPAPQKPPVIVTIPADNPGGQAPEEPTTTTEIVTPTSTPTTTEEVDPVQEEPAPPLHIEEVIGQIDERSQEQLTIVRGHGMLRVESVLVDGAEVEFEILSDAEIMIPNQPVSLIYEVQVTGGGYTAYGYPSQQ